MAAFDFAELRNYPQLRGAAVSSFSYFYLYIMFNVANGTRSQSALGKDARLREAFELAIDRDVINEVVFSGQHVPTNQWLAPDDIYYAQSLPTPKRNVGKAREILAAAGAVHPSLELMIHNTPEWRQFGSYRQ